MIFAFYMRDRLDAGTIRRDVRPAHKAYLALVADKMAFAGPLIGADGESMAGSLLAIDFDDRAAADAWLAQEPFTLAGLYGQVQISEFRNLWPQKAGFPPPEAA